MALSVRTSGRSGGAGGAGGFAWAWLGLLLPIASCVPAIAVPGPAAQLPVGTPALAAAPAVPAAQTGVLPSLEVAGAGFSLAGSSAIAANFNLPIAGIPNPAAAAYALRATTPLDQMRSLDCMTQAVYYEAGNQSEDGQRAVAQVVINRVRHPAWPNSVCGVVYQGAMRRGGGCQFTFTCDGALARTPMPALWAQARRVAAEALAGRTFAPVGMSTFYHANYVFPSWAPRLV
jgi:spore germination cell wall hydrolase CwlJ-like protein